MPPVSQAQVETSFRSVSQLAKCRGTQVTAAAVAATQPLGFPEAGELSALRCTIKST